MTPEIEKRLEDLVAVAPKVPPDGFGGCWCGLERAQYQVNPTLNLDLDVFAESVGFKPSEAYGIISGWDLAAGRSESCRASRNLPGYAEGLEFGRRLFQKYGAA